MDKLDGCIFDLDGVIVDTARYHYKAWKRIADELEIPFDERKNEDLKGVSRKRSLEKILEIGGIVMSDDEQKKLRDKKNKWYREFILEMTTDEILPGVMTFLNELKDQKIALGLATASKNGQTILSKLELMDYFDAIVDGHLITKAKPDPQIFLKCAELLGLAPQRLVVFEDAKAGVKAAKNAGMECIGVGSQKTLSQADYVISTFEKFTLADLLKIFSISEE